MDLHRPQIIEHVIERLSFTPFDAKWVPSSARCIVLGSTPGAKGALRVYDLKQGTLECTKETTKPSAIKCGTFGATSKEERHLAVGDESGTLSVWDLERVHQHVFQVKAHESIINTIDGCGGLGIGSGAPELVTGSRDGCVKVWDIRQREPVASMCPEEGTPARDCWTVCFGNAFSDEERVICAGYDNGDVKMLDLRTNKLMWETNVRNGVVCVEFDRKDIEMNKLVVTTLESRFRIYDTRTLNPTEGFAFMIENAHKSTVWVARHLPQNRDIFCSCGGDGSMNLYQYHYPKQRSIEDEKHGTVGVMGNVEVLAKETLATQPIVAVDWHPDKMGLALTTALDQAIRVCLVTRLESL